MKEHHKPSDILKSAFEPSLLSPDPKQKQLAYAIQTAIDGLVKQHGEGALDVGGIERFRMMPIPDYTHPSGFSFLFSTRRIISMDGRAEGLDNIKLKIGQILVFNENTEIPVSQAIEYAWGNSYDSDERTFAVHLSALRKKIYPLNQPPIPHNDPIIVRRRSSSTVMLVNPATRKVA